jgi:hypothetical protein
MVKPVLWSHSREGVAVIPSRFRTLVERLFMLVCAKAKMSEKVAVRLPHSTSQ